MLRHTLALLTSARTNETVRDPSGRRRDEAFFCTDLSHDAAFILETYSRRWTLEVTFHDSKQYLGFGQAQNQTSRAVARTAPFVGLVYSLVLLWAAAHLQQGGTLNWTVRPWSRSKTAVAFPDLLTALRQELWITRFSQPPVLVGSSAWNRGQAARRSGGG